MDNMIANIAETFIPPRADAVPQKNNPPARQRRDFSHAENTKPEKSQRTAETPTEQNNQDHVDSGGKQDRQDFNKVLEKKIAKDGNPKGKDSKGRESEIPASESIPSGIMIAETKIPDKIINKGISPLVKITSAKQNLQSKTEKPPIIEAVDKKPVTNKPLGPTSVKGPVKPVDKIAVNPGDPKKESAGITVKTVDENPKSNKPVVNIPQTTEKVRPDTEKPKTADPQKAHQGLKTVENNKNQPAAETKKDITQLRSSNINNQPLKADPKPVTVKSENLPQAGFQSKFEKSIENTKLKAASKASGASSEINIETDKKMVPGSEELNKASQKSTTSETRSQASSDNITQIAPDSDNKAVSADTSRFEIKPQPSNNIVNQVTEQIRASMTRGREQISIALDPPELGRVMIKFQQTNGEIVGIVEADKARTRQEIAEEMPVIIKSLNESGIQVKRVEVVLTGQDTQDALSDNSAKENNNTGRQGFNDSSDNHENRGESAGRTNYSRPYNPANGTDNYINTVSDEAINMYA